MKRSKIIVKGKWWLVFGYSLLIVLILGGIYFGISLISSVIVLPLSFLSGAGIFFFVLFYLISFIFKLIATILTTPFGILFFKNLYLELRGRGVEEKQNPVVVVQ